MRVKPILFSTPMVQAIIAGRKTVTRRIIKPQPQFRTIQRPHWAWEGKSNGQPFYFSGSDHNLISVLTDPDLGISPVDPGDILWVREGYYQVGHWEPDNDPKKKRKSGRQPWKFIPDTEAIRYSDNPPVSYRKGRHKESPEASTWHNRLGRFMPKSAARVWLQVEGVTAERLQDITEEEAIAEGVEVVDGKIDDSPGFRNYLKEGVEHAFGYPKNSFFSLWDTINGYDANRDNPWVWVIRFKVLSTTGRPDNI